MLTRSFALATLERAVKTFAQTLAALLVADGTDLLSTDWRGRLSVAGMAAVVSVLTSVGSGAIGGDGPSAGGEVLAGSVVSKVDPASPTDESAGPAADLPEGEPTLTVPGSTLPDDDPEVPYAAP